MGVVLGGAATLPALAQTPKPGTSLHQEVDYKVSPERIYQVLLDAKQFAAFTKLAAEIDPVPGGAFKLFGGLIEGRNVELVPNRRIVQAWRPASWPVGEYSVARFELSARGPEARVALDHSGFTEDKWAHLNDGWKSNYWEPLHKYLNA